MRKLNLLLLTTGIFLFVACSPKATPSEDSEEDNVEATVSETSEETMENPEGYFGKVIDAEGAVSVDEFSEMMNNNDDTVRVKIAAVAKDVCQKKGCWMKVQTADGDLMRIRFKDYGFFVPLDISGKNVVFEGIAYRDTVTVEELKHYAEDGGKSAEEIAAITEPEIKTSFLADGVMVVQ